MAERGAPSYYLPFHRLLSTADRLISFSPAPFFKRDWDMACSSMFALPAPGLSTLDCVSFLVYSRKVVASFRHKGLHELYLTGKTRRIGPEYVRKCVRILQSLEVAEQPGDMNVAGYRFHSLRGSPQRWSVRVTGNYRITFGWSGENPEDVDFEDYH